MSSQKEVEDLMEKGDSNLKAAEVLLREGFYDVAVSRAYYAMFYYASATLLTKNLRFSKHSGTISAFNLHFVKEGIFPPETFKKLRDVFEDRSESDYTLKAVSKEEAEFTITNAQEFITPVELYLKRWLSGWGKET